MFKFSRYYSYSLFLFANRLQLKAFNARFLKSNSSVGLKPQILYKNDLYETTKERLIELFDNESPTDYLIHRLRVLFGITSEESSLLLKKYPELSCLRPATVSTLLLQAEDRGVWREFVKRYPTVLLESDFSYKLDLIKPFDRDINFALPLMKLPIKFLQREGIKAKYEATEILEGSRISFVGNKLNCCPSVIADLIALKYKHILTMPLKKLQDAIQVLLNAGITGEDMRRDFWILNYSIDTIEKRVEIIKQFGIEPIKVWMIKCSMPIFEKYFHREKCKKEILKEHSSVVSYLSENLGCSIDVADYLVKKNPQLLGASIKKLKQMLEFLYAEGFTADQICAAPRIFFYRLDTIDTRLKQFKQLDVRPTSLMVLCKSRRDFNTLLKKLKKKAKKKRKE